MKRFISVLLLHIFLLVGPAQADWRWSKPDFKEEKISYWCDSTQCIKSAHMRARAQRQHKIRHYNHNRLKQWKHWTSLYIPDCTWYGESGSGPEYARDRYDLRNGGSHGPPIEGKAHGKFQFMPSTYRSVAKYGDWSPLDQEIAARRLYWSQGSTPWEAC